MRHRWIEDGFNEEDLREVFDKCLYCGARRKRTWSRKMRQLVSPRFKRANEPEDARWLSRTWPCEGGAQ